MSLCRKLSNPYLVLKIPDQFVTVDMQAGMVGARRKIAPTVVAETVGATQASYNDGTWAERLPQYAFGKLIIPYLAVAKQ